MPSPLTLAILSALLLTIGAWLCSLQRVHQGHWEAAGYLLGGGGLILAGIVLAAICLWRLLVG